MLVDSGSTYNFLDFTNATQLGCTILPLNSHSVSVARGGTLTYNAMCPYFTWEVQDTIFYSVVFLLPLGGCDLVLGVQWL